MMLGVVVDLSMQVLADPIQNGPWTTYSQEATATIYTGERQMTRENLVSLHDCFLPSASP
jgi:hypothetical protein